MRFHHLHAAEAETLEKVCSGAGGAEEWRKRYCVCALGRNAACSWWRKLIGEIAKGGLAVRKLPVGIDMTWPWRRGRDGFDS
jgi:hypothetical protein